VQNNLRKLVENKKNRRHREERQEGISPSLMNRRFLTEKKERIRPCVRTRACTIYMKLASSGKSCKEQRNNGGECCNENSTKTEVFFKRTFNKHFALKSKQTSKQTNNIYEPETFVNHWVYAGTAFSDISTGSARDKKRGLQRRHRTKDRTRTAFPLRPLNGRLRIS
jgi:hypothetical protein